MLNVGFPAEDPDTFILAMQSGYCANPLAQ